MTAIPERLTTMKYIPVADAVGSVLFHDITRIVPGECKGPVFRKGHIVTEADIPVLLDVGKEHLYVFEQQPGMLHENEAAGRIVDRVAGQNLLRSEPVEGKITLRAARHGLLRIDTEALVRVNSLGEIALATLHSLQEVQENQAVAGTRVIPLTVREEKIAELERQVPGPIVEVLPLRSVPVGIVTTGSEIYHGRIKDGFGPVLEKKCAGWGCPIMGQKLTSDDVALTSAAIREFVAAGAGMVLVTGGMSVDPDDRSPLAIREAGATVVSYGAPMFPGAMFLLAHIGDVPVMGLPGCVMYHAASIFDIVVPRLLAGLTVTAQDIASLGHGGFCASCPECRYPLCSFGKI
ncbi:Molybdopterin-binding domain protein [uncultured delta proteobacterium]|uniref:Molybdopterin molybdenumtransferase n=1 Tax=uncultured delta proteobacterium TaxID=34034 RepID=A0A212JBS6_9DELT|nr:Molybdopterin-binding domain protein [uncultured delta proteobacterium]